VVCATIAVMAKQAVKSASSSKPKTSKVAKRPKPAKAAPRATPKAKAKTAKATKTTKPTKPTKPTKATKPTKTTRAMTKAKAPQKPRKARATAAPISVSITMWEPVMPIERGERYEDPLLERLEQAGLGAPGDGGGTLQGKTGEIEQIDFDVSITSLDAIPLIVEQLEAAGAPRGSVLRYEDTELAFGACEGIAIYLDGVGQPAEVYAKTSAQELVDQILAVAPTAELRGSWQGPRETALYLYATRADALWQTIEPVVRGYPLSRTARVVLRHGSPANDPRELAPGR